MNQSLMMQLNSSSLASLDRQAFDNITVRNHTSIEAMMFVTSSQLTTINVICSILIFLVFASNLFTIVVLICGKKTCKGISLYLINLAVSDLCIAFFSVPFTVGHLIYNRWYFWPILCRPVSLMQITSVTVSVYTMAAIGIDRYLAIAHSFTLVSQSFRRKVVGAIWAGAFILGFVHMSHTQLFPFRIADESVKEIFYDCKETWSRAESTVFTIATIFITFLIPGGIIVTCNSIVGYRVWIRQVPGETDIARESAVREDKVRVFKMMFTVIWTYVICWSPYQIWIALIFINPLEFTTWLDGLGGWYIAVTLTFYLMSMTNSLANPPIYCYFSSNFREDVMQVIPDIWHGAQRKLGKAVRFCTGTARRIATRTRKQSRMNSSQCSLRIPTPLLNRRHRLLLNPDQQNNSPPRNFELKQVEKFPEVSNEVAIDVDTPAKEKPAFTPSKFWKSAMTYATLLNDTEAEESQLVIKNQLARFNSLWDITTNKELPTAKRFRTQTETPRTRRSILPGCSLIHKNLKAFEYENIAYIDENNSVEVDQHEAFKEVQIQIKVEQNDTAFGDQIGEHKQGTNEAKLAISE